jgi:large subunit ribosomal protein L28
MECFHCKKKAVAGRSHTHHRGVAGGRWKKRAPKTQRLFKPNLHKVYIILQDKKQRVLLCSKCLKRVKKDTKDGVKPFVTFYKPYTPKEPVNPLTR